MHRAVDDAGAVGHTVGLKLSGFEISMPELRCEGGQAVDLPVSTLRIGDFHACQYGVAAVPDEIGHVDGKAVVMGIDREGATSVTASAVTGICREMTFRCGEIEWHDLRAGFRHKLCGTESCGKKRNRVQGGGSAWLGRRSGR